MAIYILSVASSTSPSLWASTCHCFCGIHLLATPEKPASHSLEPRTVWLLKIRRQARVSSLIRLFDKNERVAVDLFDTSPDCLAPGELISPGRYRTSKMLSRCGAFLAVFLARPSRKPSHGSIICVRRVRTGNGLGAKKKKRLLVLHSLEIISLFPLS